MTSRDTWILDTVAPFHHTFDRNQLQALTNQQLQEETRSFMVPIRGRGLIWNEKFKILDVLYIPDVTMNIISVRQLADQGLITVFKNEDCCVRHRSTGHRVGFAKIRSGMYVLDYLHVGQDTHASQLARTGMSAVEESGRSHSELQLEESSREEPHGERHEPDRHNGDCVPKVLLVCEAYQYYVLPPYNSNVYIVASGVTNHMTPDKDVLQGTSYIEVENPMFREDINQRVDLGNGKSLAVSGIGNIVSNNGIMLDDVLHVPGLSANFISVSQLNNQLTEKLKDQLQQEGLTRQGIVMGVHDMQMEIHKLSTNLESMGLPPSYTENIACHLRAMGDLRLLINVVYQQLHLQGLRPEQNMAVQLLENNVLPKLRIVKTAKNIADMLEHIGVPDLINALAKLRKTNTQLNWLDHLKVQLEQSGVPNFLVQQLLDQIQDMCNLNISIQDLALRLNTVGVGPLGVGDKFAVMIGQVEVGGGEYNGLYCMSALQLNQHVVLSIDTEKHEITVVSGLQKTT